jgi:hypothetical protein
MRTEQEDIDKLRQQINYDLDLFRQLPFADRVEQVLNNLKDAYYHIAHQDKKSAIFELNAAIQMLNAFLADSSLSNDHKINIQKMITNCEAKRDAFSKFIFTPTGTEGDLS